MWEWDDAGVKVYEADFGDCTTMETAVDSDGSDPDADAECALGNGAFTACETITGFDVPPVAPSATASASSAGTPESFHQSAPSAVI